MSETSSGYTADEVFSDGTEGRAMTVGDVSSGGCVTAFAVDDPEPPVSEDDATRPWHNAENPFEAMHAWMKAELAALEDRIRSPSEK